MDYIVKFADYIDEAFQTPWALPNKPDAPFVRILRRLMNDEDAKIALALTPVETTAEELAAKLGKKAEAIIPVLDKLVDGGVIFDIIRDGKRTFKLVPIAPGILEFQMNKRTLDKEMVDLLEEYYYDLAEGQYPNLSVGTMRIVPVQESIEADSKSASYEELMTFINATDKYAVAPCLCRSMKRQMGEGCGHMLETCMLFGDYADYYVRTGRGRSVTKEELLKIVKQVEEEGLVHHVFSFDKGFSEYVCNCCGCCCLTTRGVTQQKLHDGGGTTRTNYCAEVDPEKCVGCGECAEACIWQAVKLGTSLTDPATQWTPRDPNADDPADTTWLRDRWDPNYRNRPLVAEGGTSPCKTACPAHISVQGYIKMASEGKYSEALKLIKQDNPFAAVCGRICPAPCEKECTRNKVDQPVAIDAIKRFIADQELESGARFVPEIKASPETVGMKVAVVGSGPAGLSAAYYLAIQGLQVTVYEKEEVLGGMLTLGIPSFRLDKDTINAEIAVLADLGVKFVTGVEVGKYLTLDQLRADGFKAFYFAVGAQKSRKLGLAGEELAGVIPGVDYLKNVNYGRPGCNLSGNVIVIGGGNVAIDVARAAIRSGAKSVNMFSLECREEMPAWEDELAEALEEGVVLNPSWGPKAILQQDGKVTGIEFKKCISCVDEEGRFSPAFDENDTQTVAATTILVAIGQTIDWAGLTAGTACKVTPRNTMQVAELSYQTDQPDIFAGGDAVTGPQLAINAIAAGKQAAISIQRYLRGDNLTLGRDAKFVSINKDKVDVGGYDRLPRQKSGKAVGAARARTFEDLTATFTAAQLRKETQRCLNCGQAVVNPELCMGCGICTVHCDFDAIHMVKVRDIPAPDSAMEYIMDSVKYRAERAARIEAKKKTG